MVGRWQGAATRSLVMHADPLAAYAYRWLGGIAPVATIDRWFGWFWRHLRGLGRMFDMVVCANGAAHASGFAPAASRKAETVRDGRRGRAFSPRLRSPALRAAALASLGLDRDAILLVGVGRFSAEKRWDMVIRAAELRAPAPVGLLLVGDGAAAPQARAARGRARGNVAVHAADSPTASELARLLASADALVHGCEAETFCMVAAEARASGIPLIVPDRGAAVDQLRARRRRASTGPATRRSLERAISRFIDRGPELQRAAAARASQVRTMDEHFADCSRAMQTLGAAPRVPGRRSTANPTGRQRYRALARARRS